MHQRTSTSYMGVSALRLSSKMSGEKLFLHHSESQQKETIQRPRIFLWLMSPSEVSDFETQDALPLLGIKTELCVTVIKFIIQATTSTTFVSVTG